jgi:hypothetical protein
VTRTRILEIAAAEIGSPGHLRIMEYHRDAIGRAVGDKELEWCGLFCLWAIHQADVAKHVLWRIGGGFCEEQHLTKVRLPAPGDVAYYNEPFQHHALVHSVDVDRGTFDSIDGNQAADTVTMRLRIPLKKPTCFYSIERLLTADTEPQMPAVDPTIRIGERGPLVVHLQQRLNELGASLKLDGSFGARTADAVRSFQRNAGLKSDGIVGPRTWEALNGT